MPQATQKHIGLCAWQLGKSSSTTFVKIPKGILKERQSLLAFASAPGKNEHTSRSDRFPLNSASIIKHVRPARPSRAKSACRNAKDQQRLRSHRGVGWVCLGCFACLKDLELKGLFFRTLTKDQPWENPKSNLVGGGVGMARSFHHGTNEQWSI